MKFRLALALVAPLLLTGCLITPGKFGSHLSLMKDGTFSYSYKGEIQLLALSKLAEMGAKSEDEFAAKECYEDNGFETRTCTADEIAAQKAEWDANADIRRMKREEEAQQMKMMMGGIDPSSPEAAADFAEALSRQKGWNSVAHRGDGLFDVDFAIDGTLSHDFTFPMIEKMPVGSAFVNVILRKDGKVRVDATGFAAQGAGNPMQGMMGGMMGLAQMDGANDGGKTKAPPKMVLPEGTFSITTDGAILANNTDEGPSSSAAGQVLTWNITSRTEQAPTALIDLSS